MSLTIKERLARLDAAIAEGRVIHGAWRRVDDDGRELVCLLAALSPEVVHAGACPADVMPAWLARLTPSMDDNVSTEYRPQLIRRYAGLAHRWHVLDVGAWRRCGFIARRVALVEAMTHTRDERVLGVCDRVLGLLDRELAGDRVSDTDWYSARMAASATKVVVDGVALRVTEVAWAAARAAALGSARAAARAAAWAAAWAAGSSAAAAYEDAAEDACEAAWDRMAAAVLDAIESEIERAEA